MEHSRKHLKEAAKLILFLTALSFIKMVGHFFIGGFKVDSVPTGVPHELLMTVAIVMFVISLLLLLPQIYVGVKGIKIAKNPVPTKGHIVWTVILLVFAGLSIISIISSMFEAANVIENIFNILNQALYVLAYVIYIKYANEVLKGV